MRPIAAICVVALLSTVLLPGVVAADSMAVVDSTGDEYARVLVEADGETTDQRLVEIETLPADARHEGAVLRRAGGEYEYDESATDRRRTSADRRVSELSERL